MNLTISQDLFWMRPFSSFEFLKIPFGFACYAETWLFLKISSPCCSPFCQRTCPSCSNTRPAHIPTLTGCHVSIFDYRHGGSKWSCESYPNRRSTHHWLFGLRQDAIEAPKRVKPAACCSSDRPHRKLQWRRDAGAVRPLTWIYRASLCWRMKRRAVAFAGFNYGPSCTVSRLTSDLLRRLFRWIVLNARHVNCMLFC